MDTQLSNAPATTDRTWPLIALFSRTILFAVWQTVIAGLIALSGDSEPWDASAAWWPMTATLTNLVSIGLLVFWFRQEGKRFWDLFRFDRAHWKGDLLAVIGFLILSSPLALLPNFGLATLFYGNAEATIVLFFRPLPIWAVWISVVTFPISIALADIEEGLNRRRGRLDWRRPATNLA